MRRSATGFMRRRCGRRYRAGYNSIPDALEGGAEPVFAFDGFSAALFDDFDLLLVGAGELMEARLSVERDKDGSGDEDEGKYKLGELA